MAPCIRRLQLHGQPVRAARLGSHDKLVPGKAKKKEPASILPEGLTEIERLKKVCITKVGHNET